MGTSDQNKNSRVRHTDNTRIHRKAYKPRQTSIYIEQCLMKKITPHFTTGKCGTQRITLNPTSKPGILKLLRKAIPNQINNNN